MGHLIGIQAYSAGELHETLDQAQSFYRQLTQKPRQIPPVLHGRTVVTWFMEPSTRTRASFELAARYLGAEVLTLATEGSSMVKGETLWDTLANLEAMGIDALVVRHAEAGVPWQLARRARVPVINAGDGWHEHPTQALLDLLTVRQALGDVSGLHVAIVGDILHSRVARSDIWGFTRMGATVTLVGPPQFVPSEWPAKGVRVSNELSEVLPSADVVILLRIQKERQALNGLFSVEEYRLRWGLTAERFRLLKPGAVVLHPGPQNRGVEIDSDVMEQDSVLIGRQVTNGVAVRMAVLTRLMGEQTW
ncbi:MAG: aspartate carbamoyltransferase catalytic subunit [Sulfobacillus sp.]|nr:aspartate carbamoyltransferase catalytic subunit [Sulfobacillus sp.]